MKKNITLIMHMHQVPFPIEGFEPDDRENLITQYMGEYLVGSIHPMAPDFFGGELIVVPLIEIQLLKKMGPDFYYLDVNTTEGKQTYHLKDFVIVNPII